MKVTLHPGAERDIGDAAAFYEREGSQALAATFVAEFKRVAMLLLAHPEVGLQRTNGSRGLSMKVFPYTVIYRVDGDEMRILVVKHDRRRPGFGAARS